MKSIAAAILYVSQCGSYPLSPNTLNVIRVFAKQNESEIVAAGKEIFSSVESNVRGRIGESTAWNAWCALMKPAMIRANDDLAAREMTP
jgi:hypothetical protein